MFISTTSKTATFNYTRTDHINLPYSPGPRQTHTPNLSSRALKSLKKDTSKSCSSNAQT